MADCKVIWKVISFCQNNSSGHTSFTRWLTGQPQQCTAPSQGAQKMNQQCTAPSQGAQKTMLCARRLCPAKIGGHWWWCWGPGPVLSKGSQPWVSEETLSSPVPEVQTPNNRGAMVTEEPKTTYCTSELLWCQGHRTLSRCSRHQTILIVHGALNFVWVPGALKGWSTAMTDIGSHRSDHSFCHSFHCAAPPLQIRVRVLLFFAFYFLVSIIFLHVLILSISNYAVIFLSSNCRIKFSLFLSDKLIALATLSSMQLYCMIYGGVSFMWTCWIQINTVKFWIGKIKFPPQCL